MPYRILSIITAIVLLTAALFKFIGISLSPIAQVGILHHPALIVVAIEAEVVIAWWLLSGFRPALVCNVTIGLFILFTFVSAFAFYNGKTSCECFGPISINPLYICLFDIGMVLALLFYRPKEQIVPNFALLSVIRPLIGGIGLSILILGIMRIFHMDPATTLAKLKGKTVLINPIVLNLGKQVSGTEINTSIKVINHGSKPVYIAGGTSDCTCIVTKKLPCTLQVGDNIDLPVRIKLPDATGSFHRQAFLWTDDNQRYLPFKITGVMTR